MTPTASLPVRDALVLAAGNGDRFLNDTGTSKLLEPILGEPLILRTLRTAARAGITRFEIVLGFQAEAVQAAILAAPPPGVTLHFIVNPAWQLENGVSALAARSRLQAGHFAVLMGDHLFEPAVLATLLHTPLGAEDSILAVDSRRAYTAIADEATKVRLDGDRITAIGKTLESWDALDTGLFVCAPGLFDALERARAEGDTTLSGGIRDLAARGLMRASDIGDADWYDIDTRLDLSSAEAGMAVTEPV